MAEHPYDVLIIGAGAAGLTAAIYTCRKQLKTAILSPETGGATALSSLVENYPGVRPMPGLELMEQFKTAALALGATLISGKVSAVNVRQPFTVQLEDGRSVSGKTLIVAAGKVPRRLGVPGEDEFFGRGVSTCATCDGPLCKGKTVAIAGGGNAAVEAALELNQIAKKTYLIHRRDHFRADEVTVAKLAATTVEILRSHEITEIKGGQFITAITVRDPAGQVRDLPVEGLFLEIGADTNANITAPFARNGNQEIMVDDRQRTNVPGVFAAGDVTCVAYKQTVISAGDGATAALEAHRFLTLPGYHWPDQHARTG